MYFFYTDTTLLQICLNSDISERLYEFFPWRKFGIVNRLASITQT